MTDKIEADSAVLALSRLESACDTICRLRTREQYLSMIDSGQQEALLELDGAREQARTALAATQPSTAPGDEAAPTAPLLPVWWGWFIQNICELPDRNSPEDEPEAMVATPDELENCAIRAMERLAAPGDGQGEVDRSAAVNLARNMLTVRDCKGITSYGVRVLCEAVMTMDSALAAPGTATAARGQETVQVPLKFVQGFCTLAHNYSLTAVPPDYYRGTEGDAFSNAYRRCGQDLAKLRALIPATPIASRPEAPADKGSPA